MVHIAVLFSILCCWPMFSVYLMFVCEPFVCVLFFHHFLVRIVLFYGVGVR